MNVNDLFKSILEIDLDPIKTKLMHVASGEGWSQHKADAVEKEYRRFLCLMRLYPNEATAPLVDVDTFWHYHILDTMKYAVDCEKAFGYFLHHYPYVGMGDEDDQQFRLDSGDRLRQLYEATFGDAYPVAGNGAAQAALAQADVAEAAVAYCGGPLPHKPLMPGEATGAQTAYCGGPLPHERVSVSRATGAQTAYCGGPLPHTIRTAADAIRVQTAYCGGPLPHKPTIDGNALRMQTAYCGGPLPHKSAIGSNQLDAQTAYCGGPLPHQPIIAAGASVRPLMQA